MHQIKRRGLALVLAAVALSIAPSAPAAGDSRQSYASLKKQISKLKVQVSDLRQQIGEVAKQPGPQGAPGSPGADGLQGPPGPSTGPAGGDLTGSYPNPTLGANVVGTDEVGPNALFGADIDESSLGLVPTAANAQTLGGQGPAAFVPASRVVAGIGFPTVGLDILDLGGDLRVEVSNPTNAVQLVNDGDPCCFAIYQVLGGGQQLLNGGADSGPIPMANADIMLFRQGGAGPINIRCSGPIADEIWCIAIVF